MGFKMALMITEECINCDVCEPKCPNQAIYMGIDYYEINPSLCTECVGHFDTPQCQLFCPVDCIPVNPNYNESKEQLLNKYQNLQLK
jgi:ferredoxin